MTILNIGPSELLFVLILGLLVLGPERLPALARGIGTALRRMREIYVAFVSEFRNELQPIAQEVDTIASEIAGELQAIREATDLRNVLQPVADDIAKATDVNSDLNNLQRDIKAPAWEIPQSISGEKIQRDAQDYGPPPEVLEASEAAMSGTVAESVRPPPEAITVAEAILGPAGAATGSVTATPDGVAEIDTLGLETLEGEPLPDYALAQNKTALSEDDILANILGPRVEPAPGSDETAGLIASDPLVIEADDAPMPEPVIAPPTMAVAANGNGHTEARVVPPAGAFDLMSAVPNPSAARGGVSSIGRINLELTLDNPWGQIETPIRSDKLDEDSPWRS